MSKPTAGGPGSRILMLVQMGMRALPAEARLEIARQIGEYCRELEREAAAELGCRCAEITIASDDTICPVHGELAGAIDTGGEG